MLDRILFDWNQVAGLVTAAFVNAFPASVLLLSVAWVLVLVQKRWTAASRYWVWWIVLASLALLPVAQAFLPAHGKPFQTEIRDRDARAKQVSAVNINSFATPVHDPVSHIGDPTPSRLTISGLFLLVWVAAIAFQLARLVLAFRNMMTLKRSAIRPSAELQRKWHERLEICRIRRPVTLGLSSDIASPAAAGYSRPLILLPVTVVNNLTSDELDQILMHELAHVRRCDDWAITVQRFVEALLVLHPLVRLVTKKIELEREIACDDWVLSTQQPQAYASCLTKLAEFCSTGRTPRLTTAAVEHKSQLSQRIEMLLDRTRSIATRPSLRSLGSLAIIMLVLAFVSLRLPPVMAYPKLQSPAPPQAPAAPQPPAVPESHRAAQPPAPPPAPQAPAPPRAPDDDVDSIIIYSDDGHSYMYGNYSGSDHVFAHPSRNKSGSIEFRRNGKSYIIRDPATVHAAQEILRPQEDLGRRQAELSEQQGKLGEEQGKLGAAQAKLSDEQLNRETIEKLKRDLKRVEDEISHINIEETMKTASEAQSRLGDLQAEIGELQAEMGEQQSKTGARQGNLGQQQGQLGEQQSRLGAMQAKLGEEQSRAAKEARQKLNQLIDRAVANGLAQPAP